MKKINKYKRMLKNRQYFEILQRVCLVLIPNWMLYLEKKYLVAYTPSRKKIKTRSMSYNFKKGEMSDLPSILKLTKKERDSKREKELAQLFSDGNNSYFIEYNDIVVACCWALNTYKLTFDGYKKLKIDLIFDEKTCFFWDGYIAEEYRLKGFYPILMLEMINDLKDNYNKSYFLAEIDAINEISFRSHIKVGFETAYIFYYISFLGINILFVKTSNDLKFHVISKKISLINRDFCKTIKINR